MLVLLLLLLAVALLVCLLCKKKFSLSLFLSLPIRARGLWMENEISLRSYNELWTFFYLLLHYRLIGRLFRKYSRGSSEIFWQTEAWSAKSTASNQDTIIWKHTYWRELHWFFQYILVHGHSYDTNANPHFITLPMMPIDWATAPRGEGEGSRWNGRERRMGMGWCWNSRREQHWKLLNNGTA